MTKLDKCPNVLCGSEDVEVFHNPVQPWKGLYKPCCNTCGTSALEYFHTVDKAIAYWNDRPQVVDAKRLLSSLHKLRDNVNNDYNLNMLDEIIESIHNGGYNA